MKILKDFLQLKIEYQQKPFKIYVRILTVSGPMWAEGWSFDPFDRGESGFRFRAPSVPSTVVKLESLWSNTLLNFLLPCLLKKSLHESVYWASLRYRRKQRDRQMVQSSSPFQLLEVVKKEKGNDASACDGKCGTGACNGKSGAGACDG